MSESAFPFRFHPLFAIASAPFGILGRTSWVHVDPMVLTVRFGPWRVATPRANVADVSVTGPYSWYRVIGPARLSLSDSGLTFATNPDHGVCIRFVEPVPGVDPAGRFRHSALTVTVLETERLAALLDPS